MGSTIATNIVLGDLVNRAQSLLQSITQNTDEKDGFGTLSCTVYDTAWVALVKKPTQTGESNWLFPDCFAYIVKMQSAGGGWMTDTKAHVDGILSTMAGLLVLKRYSAEPLQVSVDQVQILGRVERAIESLRSQLECWDASVSNNVGFEIIVPAMLGFLAAEDSALDFDFPAKSDLLDAYHSKMSRFLPELLYGNNLVTMTHSLEALIGRVDFNRVSHHKRFGAFFASPSSTAAYLMNVSEWDGEAEAYLRRAITSSTGKGGGGVPGVFPSTNFEYTWVLSTLFRGGFTVRELSSPALENMTEVLRRNYEESDGVIGLAAGIEPDVDDTAKLMTTFGHLGENVHPHRLVEVFEEHTHFRVYKDERDASFSANCNALVALLHPEHCDRYSEQVTKLAEFLCSWKWNSDAATRDKWNTSHLYSSLLFAQAFTDLLFATEQGYLLEAFDETFLCKACICLYQTCLRPLLDQLNDGSWGHCIEETAYAVCILGEAQKLFLFHDLQHTLGVAIDAGVQYILSFSTTKTSRLWSDKVSYGSVSITEAYILAALRQATVPFTGAIGCSALGNVAVEGFAKQIDLFHKTPLFETVPRWEMTASLIDAMLFERFIKVPKLQILPSNGVRNGAYLKMVPFTWTSCSNRSRTYASPRFLYEMMVLSYFTYQVDEFMESTGGPDFRNRFGLLRKLIDQTMHHPLELPLALDLESCKHLTERDATFSQDLSHCVNFMLQNNVIKCASFYDRRHARQELRHFLLAHVAQLEDNLRNDGDAQLERPSVCSVSDSYARWVSTTSADHIAAPFCFAFALCTISAVLSSNAPPNTDCFPSAAAKYFAAGACRHLSMMCRMYNDLGSWDRDLSENNLNSLHFVEFEAETGVGSRKLLLYGLAEYERGRWNEALGRLQVENDGNKSNSGKRRGNRGTELVRLFCDVTDLYGQIYIVKDISSPITREQRKASDEHV